MPRWSAGRRGVFERGRHALWSFAFATRMTAAHENYGAPPGAPRPSLWRGRKRRYRRPRAVNNRGDGARVSVPAIFAAMSAHEAHAALAFTPPLRGRDREGGRSDERDSIGNHPHP